MEQQISRCSGRSQCHISCSFRYSALITDFVKNINNFNVIYLLTQDVFVTQNQALANSHAKEVDLLVTWLFRLTNEYYDYKMASVIGIIVFIICAAFTLISFSRMISGDKEEEYQ